jgi:deferrochelatase/peroxidase EfeB
MSENNHPEYRDIQALARFGHGGLKEARFLLLAIVDLESAREWLGSAPVSNAEIADPVPETAMQIAFTSDGLRALQLNETVLEGFSEEFITGMAVDGNRSRRLGDVAQNAVANWTWGGDPETTPHVLVMLYAKTGQLEDWSETVQSRLFEQAFDIIIELDTVNKKNTEPFGFTDSISQPAIDWERKQPLGLQKRDHYSNLMALGELLLGYPNEYGQYTSRPLINPQKDERAALLPVAEDEPQLHDLGRNGSYLVMRQLNQNVPAFWKYLDEISEGDPVKREQLASTMVGRKRDGTPLVDVSNSPIEGIKTDGVQAEQNQFNYDDDPHGQHCPIGSHIRRSNPRTGDFPPVVTGLLSRLIRTLGFGRKHPDEDLIASVRFHRLLRRGRAYGRQFTPEQALSPDAPGFNTGMHFICLMASISRQFEFVQNSWSMGPKFGGLQNESDPLLGNRQPLVNGELTNHFSHPSKHGPGQCLRYLPSFVTVQGGAYFFMPGIRALRYLVSGPVAKDGSNDE